MLSHLRSSLLGFALVLPPALLAQGPSPQVAAAWSTFQEQSPGQWLVRWHPAAGTPLEIYGVGLDLVDWRENSLAEARRHANAALRRWPELLGLGVSEFREEIGARMGRTWSFTFAQWFQGLPVIGGRADVRIHMRGRLSFLGSMAVPVAANFDTTPKIDEATAVAIAWRSRELTPNRVPQPGTPRAPRLVIWSDAGANTIAPPQLAWEVPVSAIEADGSGPCGRVYVDARRGRPLAYRNDKHECGLADCTATTPAPLPPATYTVMGYLHSAFSPVSTPTNEPLAGVEVTVPGHGTVITDQNGQFTLNLANPVTVTVDLDGIHNRRVLGSNAPTATLTLQPGLNQTFQLGAANSSANELAHTTTYFWVHRINELLRGIVGNVPELDVADLVTPTVNIQSSCNAYYTSNSINFYHATGSCNNTAGASVIAHEWGHGLDDRFGGISQTNGLSEGWGDICSMYLLDDPIVGHDFFASGGSLRNGNNTRQYPTGSGPHAQGQSWMGFAWKFRQNLRAQLGNQQAIAISNDVVLGSIVANAIDQPNAVVQAFIADDDDGNIVNGTPHHAQLAAACNSHNLPYPPILAGFLAHQSPLGYSTEPLKPRFVECDAVPSYGTFTQVRVHYDDGQPQQRVMIPTGTANRYRALLPGVPSPQLVTYHFEAVHSGNAQFRLPTTGEYSYITLADEIVWREDFETGAPGWTHGASSGSDDWEIGPPGGFGGTTWADPSAAASGTQCAGTDLSVDGAYSPSSQMWLRSPPIDCTGYTNLRLRLKRWASCDVGFLDYLQIRINGVLLYWSPQSVLLETQWTTYDVPLPTASNNPAVTIEFSLTSDASVQLGGWNIDDVEIYTTNTSLPLTTTMRLLPEQAQQGTPLSLSIQTPASQPFLWIVGGLPGPTQLTGVPPIQVGGNYLTFFGWTDATGNYALPTVAPANVPLTGMEWYSQVLTLDSNATLVTSNPFVNLFTQ